MAQQRRMGLAGRQQDFSDPCTPSASSALSNCCDDRRGTEADEFDFFGFDGKDQYYPRPLPGVDQRESGTSKTAFEATACREGMNK